MFDEKTAKQQLKQALEDFITMETVTLSFLRDEYGEEAIKKLYSNYRLKFITELQFGKMKRALAKTASKIAKKTLLKIMIDTFVEKGGWFMPKETIIIESLTKEGATVRISQCRKIKTFKKIVKKKRLALEPTYLCHSICIPEINNSLNIVGLIPKVVPDEKQCLISVQWDPKRNIPEPENDESALPNQ